MRLVCRDALRRESVGTTTFKRHSAECVKSPEMCYNHLSDGLLNNAKEIHGAIVS